MGLESRVPGLGNKRRCQGDDEADEAGPRNHHRHGGCHGCMGFGISAIFLLEREHFRRNVRAYKVIRGAWVKTNGSTGRSVDT